MKVDQLEYMFFLTQVFWVWNIFIEMFILITSSRGVYFNSVYIYRKYY